MLEPRFGEISHSRVRTRYGSLLRGMSELDEFSLSVPLAASHSLLDIPLRTRYRVASSEDANLPRAHASLTNARPHVLLPVDP
jgi:hypothetical protein